MLEGLKLNFKIKLRFSITKLILEFVSYDDEVFKISLVLVISGFCACFLYYLLKTPDNRNESPVWKTIRVFGENS